MPEIKVLLKGLKFIPYPRQPLKKRKKKKEKKKEKKRKQRKKKECVIQKVERSFIIFRQFQTGDCFRICSLNAISSIQTLGRIRVQAVPANIVSQRSIGDVSLLACYHPEKIRATAMQLLRHYLVLELQDTTCPLLTPNLFSLWASGRVPETFLGRWKPAKSKGRFLSCLGNISI